MEVEDQGHPDEAQGQARDHEEVRQGVDLDQGVAPAAVGPGHGPRSPDEEGEVLAQVDRQARALVALDVEAVDPHAGQGPGRRVTRSAQGEHVDRPAARGQGLGLAPDPRILLVIGVDDHAHRTPAGARLGGRHEARRTAVVACSGRAP